MDEGCEDILKYYLDNKATKLVLFSNNYDPVRGSAIGDLTLVSGEGAPKTLAAASWSVNETQPRSLEYGEQTFTFTGVIGGSGSVYGYGITDNAQALLIVAKKFSTPFTPTASGGILKITPKIKTSNGTAA
jgi:hypothetical protein